MSQFWAKFENIKGDIFRFDTRIYLNKIDKPEAHDMCVGAIVGKNPGSAKASSHSPVLQSVELDGDKLLPTVKNIITKAYKEAQIPVPLIGYIQVLNLFYLGFRSLADRVFIFTDGLFCKLFQVFTLKKTPAGHLKFPESLLENVVPPCPKWTS